MLIFEVISDKLKVYSVETYVISSQWKWQINNYNINVYEHVDSEI